MQSWAQEDPTLLPEAEAMMQNIYDRAQSLHLQTFLSRPEDALNAFIEIHAGAGGTEAQDWVAMLARMYTRWGEKAGYTCRILEEYPGEEAGLKATVLHVRTKEKDHPYGWLKGESGVHRLVRNSPFDAAARRHTSFASVWVYPEVDQSIQVDLQEKDIRVDTYRASGAGGQHVNKTDSAVRLTHIPTGIVVQCQSDRSQHRNRAQAYDRLRARLYAWELKKREESLAQKNAEKSSIEWGQQIRSYVLQPYQMVKDLRTGWETSQALRFLEGDLDEVLKALLTHGA